MKSLVASIYRSFGVGFGGRVYEDTPPRVTLEYEGRVYVLTRDEINSAPLLEHHPRLQIMPAHLDRAEQVADDGIRRVAMSRS